MINKSFLKLLTNVLRMSFQKRYHLCVEKMINLIHGTSLPNRPPYRVSYAQQEEILTQANKLLEKGLVRPSSSPFCLPILLVQKKDGSYRMCIDYRALNKHTIKDQFLVPCIEDIFDQLQRFYLL